MVRGAFIGIDRHSDPNISDLNGAVRDAKALWAVLSDSIDGMTAMLLTNADANTAAVIKTLDDALGAAELDDVVLISFAGHGTPDHRLVMADTIVADLPGTTINMADIADRFRRTRARAVLLLLDCCFSGGAPARVLDLGVIPRALGIPLSEVAGEGRILFAASAPDQPALEDHKTRHGLFTKAILDQLLAGGPVSVVGMVDEVQRTVRAEAGRLGYEQTPVMFGHVEGEVTLPACRRGARYLTAFPEYAPIRTTGSFDELAGYEIPEEVLEVWRGRYPSGLNALQIAAINDHNVLMGNSLLVVAPTSAGKTFIGEIASIRAIADGRKAVFLLPYRALVNEKYEDFSALYGEGLGLRIARCSGDWQDQVGAVLRGKYDIAFFTYEKFLALALAYPHVLSRMGLVVVDEAQFITVPDRGMNLELLLTFLLAQRQRGVAPQLIALSAVIGNVNGFERWLNCNLLVTTERPVPLLEGVIDRTGTWKFLPRDREAETAQLLDRSMIRQRKQEPSSQDVIVPLVRHLVGLGEKVIIFRNRKGPSSGCANYLADELGLPPATEVIASLPSGDQSAMSANLRKALGGGVAFHIGDLNREERVAVERSFRQSDGGIHVLVATSTIAAGVNTPASTVIVVETEFRDADGPKPYTVAEYKNMAGRAGRLGFETQGKAMLIAGTPFDRDHLFRTYVAGTPEALRSSFDDQNPATWLIKLMAQVRGLPRGSIIDLLANTYGGYLSTLHDPRWREGMAATVDPLLDRMIRDGLIAQDGGGLRLTMLGRACGESPLSLELTMRLVEVLRRLRPPSIQPENLVVLVEVLAERDADYTPQTGKRGEPRWQQALIRRFGPEMAGVLQTGASSDKEYYARCKRALIVADWIDGVPIRQIEATYTVNAVFSPIGYGDIQGFADGSRYLLESAIRIASLVLEQAVDEVAAAALLKRLELGMPAAALALTELGMALTRGELLGLWQAGIVTRENLVTRTESELVILMGERGRILYSLARVDIAAAG